MKSKVLLLITGLALLGVAVVSSARAQDFNDYDVNAYECLGQVCIHSRVQLTQGYYAGERGTVVSLDYYRNSATIYLDLGQYHEADVRVLYVVEQPNPYPPQPYPTPYPPNPYPQPQPRPRPVVCPPGYYYDHYRGVCIRPNHPGPRPQPRPHPRPQPRPRPIPHPHPGPGPAPRPMPNPGGHCPPGTHYDPSIQRCVR